VTRRSLAAALIEMDLAGEALAHARAAVQLDPADAYGRLILGVALAGNGHGAAAAQEFRRALERDPSMTEARDLLAMIEQQPRPRPGHE
jgi:Flp pilus assembly protein TadD